MQISLDRQRPLRAASRALMIALGCWAILLLVSYGRGSARSQPATAAGDLPTLTVKAPVATIPVLPPRKPEVPPVTRNMVSALQQQVTAGQQALRDQLSALQTDNQALRMELQQLQHSVERVHQDLAQVATQAEVTQLAAAVAHRSDHGDQQLQALESRLFAALQARPEPQLELAASPLLTTKLYLPAYLTADQLGPLLEPLLTPGIGLWAAGGRDAAAAMHGLLVRDRPEVVALVDQLIDELDRPPLRVELDVAVEAPASPSEGAATPQRLASDRWKLDGTSHLIPVDELFRDGTAERSAQRLRITPRIVR